MSANTAAGALSRFLSATPETPNSGAIIERIAILLKQVGDDGIELSKASDLAGVSKADFVTVLPQAQATSIFEIFTDADGQSKLRLGQVGKSLF